jgi:hypothetical protein
MTTDILAQQTADLAVTKAQLRAAVDRYEEAMHDCGEGTTDACDLAKFALQDLINALPIPDGASDGEGSEK